VKSEDVVLPAQSELGESTGLDEDEKNENVDGGHEIGR